MSDKSGADLGGVLWLVLLSAIGVVGVYFHFNSKGESALARLPIIWCSVVGIVIMLLQWLRYMGSEYSEMFRFRFGSIGTLLGLALALYGTTQLPQETGRSADTSRLPE